MSPHAPWPIEHSAVSVSHCPDMSIADGCAFPSAFALLVEMPSESTGGGKGAMFRRERSSLISRCCVSTWA